MPAAFNRCISKGGRVRTKKLGGRKYMLICYLDKKAYPGEVHTRTKRRKKK